MKKNRKIIPWRVKIAFANHFPRLYYLMNNLIARSNSEKYSNHFLRNNWDNSKFNWPTKNTLFQKYLNKDDKILDIAFGTATLLRSLKANGYKHLWGYEQSNYALRRIADLGINSTKNRLPKINYPDNYFYAVIASEVLEHILKRRKLLAEFCRVIKPTGIGIISVPDNTMGPEEIREHTFKYNRETIELILSKYFYVKELYSIKDINHRDKSLVAVVRKTI